MSTLKPYYFSYNKKHAVQIPGTCVLKNVVAVPNWASKTTTPVGNTPVGNTALVWSLTSTLNGDYTIMSIINGDYILMSISNRNYIIGQSSISMASLVSMKHRARLPYSPLRQRLVRIWEWGFGQASPSQPGDTEHSVTRRTRHNSP